MFANSKKVTTFAPAIEREILDKKDGPFVYRLGRKIFILERGVRFPHGLPFFKETKFDFVSFFVIHLRLTIFTLTIPSKLIIFTIFVSFFRQTDNYRF